MYFFFLSSLPQPPLKKNRFGKSRVVATLYVERSLRRPPTSRDPRLIKQFTRLFTTRERERETVWGAQNLRRVAFD